MSNELVYNGVLIRDRDEMLSLTDMWRSAGSPDGRGPADWRALSSSVDFVEHIEAIAGKSGNEVFQVVRGGSDPGTWAHWHIGLAYAKYLSPEFHVWCNVAAREKMEGKRLVPDEEPSKLLSRALIVAYKQLEENREDANAFRRIKASEGSQNLTDASKLLRMNRKTLIAWLNVHHWIYRRLGSKEWVGYDYHTKNGDLEHVLHEITDKDGKTFSVEQVRITVQGLAKLAKIFGNLDSAA